MCRAQHIFNNKMKRQEKIRIHSCLVFPRDYPGKLFLPSSYHSRKMQDSCKSSVTSASPVRKSWVSWLLFLCMLLSQKLISLITWIFIAKLSFSVILQISVAVIVVVLGSGLLILHHFLCLQRHLNYPTIWVQNLWDADYFTVSLSTAEKRSPLLKQQQQKCCIESKYNSL